MTRSVLAAVLISIPAFCQSSASFSPQETIKTGYTPWAVTVCSPASGNNTFTSVPVGKLYQVMIAHQITPLSFQSALQTLSLKANRSVLGKILLGVEIASQITAAALATKVVVVNQNLTNTFTVAANGFTVARSIISAQQPGLSPLISQIPHDNDSLAIPPGACTATVLLGSYAAAFNAPIP